MTYAPQLAALALALAGSTLARAQPRSTTWAEGPPSTQVSARALAEDCGRPPGAILVGDTISFEIDTTGGYGASVTLDDSEPNAFGRAIVVVDARVRYEAFPEVGEGGTDVLRVRACLADGTTCRESTFEVTVAEVGRRADTTFAIQGGERVLVPVLRPGGELFCESVMTVGTYEAPARRAAFLTGEGLRYNSARVPGVDELQVVACGVSGVCDTTYVTVDVLSETLELPICDDFSGAGGRPNPRLWLEDDVSVGDGYAIAPPSVGVATFDGLDASGVPYGDGFGESDALTSTTLALGDAPDDLYLKYFLQIGGLGQAPEREDVMYVEARREDGTWATLNVHRGSPSSTPVDTFDYHSVAFDGAELLHDRAQIRFRTEGNRRGENDIWNLDYVRLERGADADFADIAIAGAPAELLSPYTAVPYRHFRADPARYLAPGTAIELYNHFPGIQNVTSSRVSVIAADGANLLDEGLLFGQQLNLPPGYSAVVNDFTPEALDRLVANLTALDADAAAEITTRYTLTIDADQERLPCVLRNDTAEAVTLVGEVFAYDDGTAEGGLLPGGRGELLAQRFVAAVDDTLRGLRFRFPRLSDLDADEQLINLRVWVDSLDDTPDFEGNFVSPFYPASRDGEQPFTTFPLEDARGRPAPIAIPAGVFYVGWQQASDVDEPVPVGVDFSRDRTDEVFANFANEWVPLPSVLPTFRGALMLRPVFSEETPLSSEDFAAPVQDLPSPRLTVAPNPTPGALTLIDLPDDARGGQYEVRDVTGRLVARGPVTAQINLARASAGVYVLTLRSAEGTQVAHATVIVE